METPEEKELRAVILAQLGMLAPALEQSTPALGAVRLEYLAQLLTVMHELVTGNLDASVLVAISGNGAMESGYIAPDASQAVVFELAGRLQVANLRAAANADEQQPRDDDHAGHGCPDDPTLHKKSGSPGVN